MEGEVKNFIMVWMAILPCLLYCHSIAKFIPQGTTRLLALLPIFCLFFYLPSNLFTMHLCGLTSFFIAWLANFKLLLFAFGKGPLSTNPPLPLSRFIPIACLPIKTLHASQTHQASENPSQEFAKKQNPSPKITKRGENPSQEFVQELTPPPKSAKILRHGVKALIFLLLFKVYDYDEYIHTKLKWVCYSFHIYFMLELLLGIVAFAARILIGAELEPQFDEPYLSTSLQDFWGRRWNLMVTSILHPTVYKPVRSFCDRKMNISRRWAPFPAVFATFLVSGFMHELVFFYIGRVKPTGEVTAYFIINALCLGIEIAVKRSYNGKFRLPPAISTPLTVGFVMMTSFWLFFPPFMRFDPDVRGCKETVAWLEFVRRGRLVGPNDVSCPYF